MRRFLVLLAVTGLVSLSWAREPSARSLTVAQLGQFLTGAHGRSDVQLARDIDGLLLTERLSVAQFAQWESRLPGRRSREALTALADESILLPPPPASELADAPPDAQQQKALLALANAYVSRALARLPDFSAVRTTDYFEDAPHSKLSHPPLGFVVESTTQVTYSNGAEERGVEKLDLSTGKGAESGLATAGEFGPILSVVLDDSSHGNIEWAYWEQGPQGKLAVFRYTVPQSGSSYLLTFTHGFNRVSVFPAYFGEIAIDPVRGAIFRISMLTSDLRPQNVLETAIAVDYGPVQLGGKDYICPVRGIALIRSLVDNAHGGTTPRTQINDTVFTGYHLLRGDVTILPSP